MKTVTIQILASDIYNSSYTHSSDCAMTRAFRRAGLPFYEGGGDIISNVTNLIVCATPHELEAKVMSMYAYVDDIVNKEKRYQWNLKGERLPRIPPEGFTFELEIPDYAPIPR